jgi:hypothetical protein
MAQGGDIRMGHDAADAGGGVKRGRSPTGVEGEGSEMKKLKVDA